MQSHIRRSRLGQLPQDIRTELIEARQSRGWSQAELGRRVGLPQVHVSSIETGKVVPRFDTLLDVVRVLDRDLLLVPRELVPAVQALIRDFRSPNSGERPLYALEEDEDDRSNET